MDPINPRASLSVPEKSRVAFGIILPENQASVMKGKGVKPTVWLHLKDIRQKKIYKAR